MTQLNTDNKKTINGGSIAISSIIAITGAVCAVVSFIGSLISGTMKVNEAKNRKKPTLINTNYSIESTIFHK